VPTIELGSRKIEYVMLKGTSTRYTYFRFRSDMTLEIILPRGRSVDLESALRRRQEWILKQYDQMSRDMRVLDREKVMFDGEYLKIVFLEDSEKEELQLDRVNHEVIVRSSDRSRVRELVRRWFLKETSKDVIGTLSRVSHQFPKYSRADVREMRNWGYCTKSGRLSFNWQLIALPQRLREYVVLHELTHLSEFNHSAAFKRKLAAACPDFRQRERELDKIAPMKSYLSRNL
jgi:predicted metal-dependent hydrolase